MDKMLDEMLYDPRMTGDEAMPDPDPETERMVQALEDSRNGTPDELLLDAMGSVCGLMKSAVEEARIGCMSPARMVDLLRGVRNLAEAAVCMHSCLTAGRTMEKLRFLRETERRNDESVGRWEKRHEAIHKAETGDEGEKRAQSGYCACAESE